jgi:hypothetical protein
MRQAGVVVYPDKVGLRLRVHPVLRFDMLHKGGGERAERAVAHRAVESDTILILCVQISRRDEDITPYNRYISRKLLQKLEFISYAPDSF